MKRDIVQYSFFFFISVLLPALTFADVSLEVTKGVKGQLPIGVVAFQWQGSDKTAPVALGQVVANDLSNSGQFAVQFQAQSVQPGKIDLNAWQQKKTNAVLSGEVDDQGNGQYQVHYVLSNVFKNPGNVDQNSQAVFGVDSGAELAEGQFLVSKADLRQTAHKISNQIMQKLLGVQGVFQTHLAYVSVVPVNGRVQYRLMMCDYDGANPVALLSSPEPILTPAWSPGGKSLAFVMYHQGRSSIRLMNIASQQSRMIAQFPGLNAAPTFSEDGHTLYVSTYHGGGVNIEAINLADGMAKPFTLDFSVNTSPSFMNKVMYYTSTQSGAPQIYKMNLATHQVSRVSFGGDANMQADAQNGTLVYLQQQGSDYQNVVDKKGEVQPFSPKGKVYPASVSSDGAMAVYAMQSEGKRQLLLTTISTNKTHVLPLDGMDLRYPAWSGL